MATSRQNQGILIGGIIVAIGIVMMTTGPVISQTSTQTNSPSPTAGGGAGGIFAAIGAAVGIAAMFL